MKRQKSRTAFGTLTRRRLVIAGAVILGVLVLANAVVWATYRNRTYPRSSVMGVSVGSVPFNSLGQKTDKVQLPDSIELTHGGQKVAVPLNELGISKDPGRTIKEAQRKRSWLPVINLFKRSQLPAPVRLYQSTLNKKSEELALALHKDAVSAHLTLSGTNVGIAEGQDGYQLDSNQLGKALLAGLDAGKTTVAVPTQPLAPKVQASALGPQKEKLQKQLATAVTYHYGDKTKRVAAADLATWFVPDGETYALAPDKIQAYITQAGKEFGIRVKDVPGAAASTAEAVTNQKSLDLTLIRQVAAKTYLYCVATRGVDTTHLPTFRSKLAGTLNDNRSWSLDGLVEFKEATSGCNFTAWLSAADQVPSFGGVCDAQWSCRSGANVVINFDRWQNASPAWNAASGALDEYRNMVINHETGHWLGFNHEHCSGPGQPAPVMQQQSIDLEGCAFNAWPTAGELAVLRRQLGL